MPRWILAVFLILAPAAPVAAQEPHVLTLADLAGILVIESIEPLPGVVSTPVAAQRLPITLKALCVSFVALQVADVATTYRALHAGAREANPVVGSLSSNGAALIAVKAATTVATIYVARKFAAKHKIASMVVMAAVNSALAIVVAHNYHVGSSVVH